MLKRLELVGFKSFADKTQFDFPAGITAVVGPNGSGKSNIVDAIRWILGEQSAKSLRGGEMADVIFNGSTTRRSLGLAEVTLTFDNARRQLTLDAEEVQITRRVYRSGEGEYLINQQLCRLKDIKDLFLGTGAGSQTYCIIEQGRVDGMLQASTKERRIIFEEAAGISRFKARKLETARKLERVDQNLQRLKDIVDEVEKQLRAVKLQAAKAQRYQEYSQRLKDLRVALSLDEYRQLTRQLEGALTVLEGLRAELAEHSAQTQGWETEIRRLDEALVQLDQAIHHQESRQAQARAQIAAADTTLNRERSLSADQEQELIARRSQLVELTGRTAALQEAAAAAAQEYGAVERSCQAQRLLVQGMNEGHQTTITRLELLKRQVQADHDDRLEQMRQLTRMQNEATSRRGQLESLQRERDRLRSRGDQTAESLASLDLELQALTQAEEALQVQLAAAKQKLADSTAERDRFRHLSEAAAKLAGDLRAEHSGLVSRIEVLDGLERSHEGLGAGVREVFTHLEQPDPGLWSTVLGMVADFLTVPRQYAPLIDLALGEKAQYFLVRDLEPLQQALHQRGQAFASRVSFLPIRPLTILQTDTPEPRHEAGTWAVQRVTCDHPDLANLAAQLLSQTLIVADLPTARRLAGQLAGLRFITDQGELLEPDGTLTVGAYHAGAGILSRKSELRELRRQAVILQQRIHATEHDLAGLRQHEAGLETQTLTLQEEIGVMSEQAVDLRSRIGQHRQRREDLHEEVVLSRSEVSGLEQDITALEASCQRAQADVDQSERLVKAVQQRLEQADREIRAKEQLREQQQQEREAAKVALAQVEERLKALRAKHQQIETDLTERNRERHEGEQLLVVARARWDESQRTMLQAQADLARWYLEKEAAQRQAAQWSRARDEQRHQRHNLHEQLQTAQSAWRSQQDRAHAHELEASTLRHRCDSLVGRLREDYQLDLAELYRDKAQGLPPLSFVEVADVPAANDEIEDLKRKLSRLGSVNLEALQELVELDNRAKELKTQYDDLTAAQQSLQEIIAQINQDSRRLFSQTFTTVRGHFQELFRKLFGGGRADVVLEDENDILDCGIEIIAQPPGKELRSISLMSGGEKTMTAVALLLAIFRSKPSPFCILDEVDAALDEANIGRFSTVLRDFLDLSQFILITHSKKTMATADVLYGITMQESGISKRVAVRFEDWPDDAKKNGEATGQVEKIADGQSFAGR